MAIFILCIYSPEPRTAPFKRSPSVSEGVQDAAPHASEAQAALSLNEQVPRLSVMRGAAAVVAFHGNPKSP